MRDKVLEINKISKKYKTTQALDDVSFKIKGIYGLLGPNGAGKTTLMRIIATLLSKDNGNIKYGDIEWSEVEKVRSIIGYLPQHFSMYPEVKVYEALEHIAILKGMKKRLAIKEKIEELIISLNLQEVKSRRIKELSGGMLRRVGVAQALLGNPEIVIVDEPTAGLDIEERVRFRELLRKVGRDKIVLISTHIVEDIEYTCENIAILKRGRVIKSGSRQEILDEAKGLVYEINTELYSEKYNEISENYRITSKKTSGNKVIIRFISNNSVEDATMVSPNLEEGYLVLVGEENE